MGIQIMIDQIPVQKVYFKTQCTPFRKQACLTFCALVSSCPCDVSVSWPPWFSLFPDQHVLPGARTPQENMQINERMNVFFGAINSVAALRGAAEMPVLQVSAWTHVAMRAHV